MVLVQNHSEMAQDHVTEFGGQDMPAFHSTICKNVFIANGANETSRLFLVYVRILLLIGNCWISVTSLLRKGWIYLLGKLNQSY